MEAWFAFIGEYALAIITLSYSAMLIGERLLYAKLRPGQYDDSNAMGSFLTNLMSNISAVLLGAVIPLLTYFFVYENFRLLDPGTALWTWAAAFAVHETAYHFGHWAGHRVGLFWAWHQPHHSSEELNLSTAARGFTFGDPVAATLSLSAALLGVHPLIFVTVVIAKNLWGIFNHTRLVDKMGPLEAVMATPANHRVHHGRNPRYIDKNYGQVLVLWDRLFGTYQPEDETPDFGLVEPMTSNNPIKIHFGGWVWLWKRMRSAPTLGTSLQYLWRPPEWHHDGECHGCAKARMTLEPAE
jgi:sterol desaturase/sphingolipid hydroxylase (fatty acid hydroxylase superfamily)